MTNPFVRVLVALIVVFAPTQILAQSKTDVLILGDSQISFGAGAVYLDFFENLERNCADVLSREQLAKLGKRRTQAVGVRSTSLHSWVARGGAAKNAVCEVDKKYGVNAGVYGIPGQKGRKFIQVGKEKGFQYCRKNKSAFEVAFDNPRAWPKLLILNFLGNAEKRWAESQSAADTDVQQTLKHIPADIPCVFLTTAPVFAEATNSRRMTAQTHLERALKKAGGRCRIVKGMTHQTREAIEGKPQFFRRNKSGKIIDPHHPDQDAIRLFMKSTGPALCEAVSTGLK